MILAPKRFLITSCISRGVFQLKNKEVFSQFNCCPEGCSYFSKIVINVEHSSFVDRQKIRPSSAKKNKCEIFGPHVQVATPLSVPCSPAFLINADSPSEHTKNNKGDKGFPWRKPLEGVMLPQGPLIFT